MSRVSVDDLRALLETINFAETAAEGADEDAYICKMSARAGNCYDWVLREIRRRERRKELRQAVRSAEKYLSEREPS